MAKGPKFAAFRASLTDLQLAATDRLHEAELLFANDRFASAIAMGLYSLEIQLKVRVCVRLNLVKLPIAFEIHDLEGLLVLSGLRAARDSAPPAVQLSWTEIINTAAKLNELRYQPAANWAQKSAADFLAQLRDPPHGVLPWLSAQP
jgi:hypothetical protein